MDCPKYKVGDHVLFVIENEEINGTVAIVDDIFTDEHFNEHTYDIFDDNKKVLYKHIPESWLIDLKC